MNRNDIENEITEETTTEAEEICAGEEFSILRETLRLYCQEITIH
jgi:hypothetical protein